MYSALRAGHRAMRMTSLRESESPRVSVDGYDESPGTVLSDSFSKENESRKNRPLRLIRTVHCDSSDPSSALFKAVPFDSSEPFLLTTFDNFVAVREGHALVSKEPSP